MEKSKDTDKRTKADSVKVERRVIPQNATEAKTFLQYACERGTHPETTDTEFNEELVKYAEIVTKPINTENINKLFDIGNVIEKQNAGYSYAFTQLWKEKGCIDDFIRGTQKLGYKLFWKEGVLSV
ncbi:MAG: hypothetical protein M0R17_01600 [Candidatus Omnitrophica bacterium]|jgi:hypothetical protein|nr:hypothetical protein [Candidatus Omnitrophota bacterium]